MNSFLTSNLRILALAFLRKGGVFALGFSLFAASCSTVKFEEDPALLSPPSSRIYLLRVGDIVQVDVFQEPVMTTRQRIQGDGTISVGLIGRVDILGVSVEKAADKIASMLDKKYLINPQVSVTVLAYSPRRFTLWGEVNRAGSYVIPPEQTVSLPEAIAMGGGGSDTGNLKKVIVSRKHGDKVIRFRLNALALEAQDFNVQEGDVIFVSETIF